MANGQDIELNQAVLDPFANKLLAGLPNKDFEKLSPHLISGSFAQGTVLAEAGNKIDDVYFPLSGMISLVAVMRDGKAIETATVGHDGVFGAMVSFGYMVSQVRAIVQVPMSAMKISTAQFRKAAQESDALRHLAIHYNELMLSQARVTAACNALHKVEALLPLAVADARCDRQRHHCSDSGILVGNAWRAPHVGDGCRY
jgi:CRP-like cAMP-binding protein